MFEFVVLLSRSADAKEIELLATTHEAAMLRRRVKRQSYDPTDRALLAVLKCPSHQRGMAKTNVATRVDATDSEG